LRLSVEAKPWLARAGWMEPRGFGFRGFRDEHLLGGEALADETLCRVRHPSPFAWMPLPRAFRTPVICLI